MFNSAADPTLTNCWFSSNESNYHGGAIFSHGDSHLAAVNCTLVGNRAEAGRALGCGSHVATPGTCDLANCILWDGGREVLRVGGSTITITHSDVWGGWLGVGNINADPFFVDADGPDNDPGNRDDNLRLRVHSPCLDAGDNGALPPDELDLDGDGDVAEVLPFDMDGNPRIVDGTVDMGAYEGPKQCFEIAGDPVSVPEGGTPDRSSARPDIGEFLVRLDLDPGKDLEVAVSHHSGDEDITVLIGSTLVFNSSNYSTFQSVILDAAEDPDWVEGTAIIRVSAPGVPCVDVTAIEVENDHTPHILFVDAGAEGDNTGTSWTDALTDLQDAIDTATEFPLIAEVWVAAGTYTPTGPGGDREATFQVVKGVPIVGGFPSGGGDWNERNPALHETILSGDLNGDDGPGFANNDDNSYHVVTVSPSSPELPTVIDGCSIIGGNADSIGGGIYNTQCEVVLRNCIIRGNFASLLAGAVFHTGGGAITLDGCVVSGNHSGAPVGGCVYSDWGTITFTNCSFLNNSGGGLYVYFGATITSCILWGNHHGSDYSEGAQIDWGPVMPTVHYTCVQGWTGDLGGTGNIGANPRLESDGFHLRLRSPCRNAGDPDFGPALHAIDIDGQPRILEDRVDMGADEVALELLPL